jgi:hypothetical protein
LEKDRARATAEYLAEFRTDISGFVGGREASGAWVRLNGQRTDCAGARLMV